MGKIMKSVKADVYFTEISLATKFHENETNKSSFILNSGAFGQHHGAAGNLLKFSNIRFLEDSMVWSDLEETVQYKEGSMGLCGMVRYL